MRKMNILFLTLLGALSVAASGCGSPDPGPGPGPVPQVGCPLGCSRGFLCQAQSCVLDPTSRWIINVQTGSVASRKLDGSHWDADVSPPDPFVCLTINGGRLCTQAVQDSSAPTWNANFGPATATALQAGVVVEYLDEDVSVDDPICQGTLPVTAADFTRGTWGVMCTGGSGRIDTRLLLQ